MRFVLGSDVYPEFPQAIDIGAPSRRGLRQGGQPIRPGFDKAQERPCRPPFDRDADRLGLPVLYLGNDCKGTQWSPPIPKASAIAIAVAGSKR